MIYGIKDLLLNFIGIKQNTNIIKKDEFWALHNISFELLRGEIVGIIGQNGSGKSTLLRLISGIFPPDAGHITINGRVGALIALGAGFHPHLTGKQNILLNATILGMSKSEIANKFNSIIKFAEIEQFLDAPVSTYSSGMRVRLGFAIAAHLEPEILIIDEVLSVGDMAFRDKCISFIKKLKERGTTVLIVSHYLAQISVIAEKCMWLDKGKIKRFGPTDEVIMEYQNHCDLISNKDIVKDLVRKQETTGKIYYSYIRTEDKYGNSKDDFTLNDDIYVKLEYETSTNIDDAVFTIAVFEKDQTKIFQTSSRLVENIEKPKFQKRESF